MTHLMSVEYLQETKNAAIIGIVSEWAIAQDERYPVAQFGRRLSDYDGNESIAPADYFGSLIAQLEGMKDYDDPAKPVHSPQKRKNDFQSTPCEDLSPDEMSDRLYKAERELHDEREKSEHLRLMVLHLSEKLCESASWTKRNSC
jgi:hypothetical protein